MKILLKEISTSGTNLDFEVQTDVLNSRTAAELSKRVGNSSIVVEYIFHKPAAVELNLVRDDKTVYLSGLVRSAFETSCARCAENAETILSTPLKLQLKPRISSAEAGEQDEDLEISYYSGRDIELEPLVVDFIMLNLPFSVLCSDSCKGLCSSCGANLNQISCNCAREKKPSGPLAAITDLKLH